MFNLIDFQDELDLEEEEVKEIELGRGNRMRKETNYDGDQLSEREWLKAIGVSFSTILRSSLNDVTLAYRK